MYTLPFLVSHLTMNCCEQLETAELRLFLSLPIFVTLKIRNAMLVQNASSDHLSEVVIKSLKGIADERQAHFGRLLGLATLLQGLRLQNRSIVGLVDFISREVRGVDIGRQPRFEWRPNAAKAVKLDASEKRVALDLMCSTSS